MALLSRSKVALTKREPSAKPSVSSVLEMQVCQRGVQDCGRERRVRETSSPLPCLHPAWLCLLIRGEMGSTKTPIPKDNPWVPAEASRSQHPKGI